MKKMTRLFCLLTVTALGVLAPGTGFSKDLAVTRVDQITTDSNGNRVGDQWCWAACAKMILDYYGYPKTLGDIASFGQGNASYGTWNYGWGSGTERRPGVPVWMPDSLLSTSTTYKLKNMTVTLNWHGIPEIIRNFSNNTVATQNYPQPISADQVDREINEFSAPLVINLRWILPPTRTGKAWRDLGGHFVVCFGSDSGNHSIHDPWFGTYIQSDATLRSGSAGAIDANLGNRWATTITTSSALDVVFLFDTTGSMGGHPGNIFDYANALLDTIATYSKNYRVAVANFKDYPEAPYGDPGDYVFQANLPFTSGTAGITAAKDAISGLVISGGGSDTSESVYSALFNTLSGNGIGAWRTNSPRRMVILFGDAPGHDPEPWVGGHSFGDTIPLATGSVPIAIHCISPASLSQFSQIAASTGGVSVAVSNSGTSASSSQLIDTLTETQRIPQRSVGAIYPIFTLDPVGQSSMARPSTNRLIEIQKLDPATNVWKRVRLVTIKDPAATQWISSRPFAQATYRWRLGFSRSGGQLYLPSSGKIITTPASTQFEPGFTEFQRVANPPGFVTMVSPASGTPSGTTVSYQFGAVPGASNYILRIFQDGKLWHTYTVRAPAKNPNAAVLAKTVTGHKLSALYTWQVQALNYDRPKPFDYWWTSSN